MKEFASALLVGMARTQLARRNLLPDHGQGTATRTAEATVPLNEKRELLSRVACRHGLKPILEIGRGIAELPPDPALEALRHASDPLDMVARWRRLERYVHSRHRIVIEEQSASHVVLRHCSNDPDGPRAEEDALIIGVLAALAESVGAAELTTSLLAEGEEQLILANGRFVEPLLPAAQGTNRWRFRWRLRESDPDRNGAAHASEHRTTARAAVALVGSDPGREWSLSSVAAGLAVSERTLQRRLAAEGANFAAVIRSARVEAAGRMLIGTDHSLAKIGFVCGFSDQPHFTTLFKRQTGLTPGTYRKSFA